MKDKDKIPFEPENFEQLYFHLFNKVTDAIYYLQGVQAELEEMYIRMQEKEEQRPLGTLLEWPLRFSITEDGKVSSTTKAEPEQTTDSTQCTEKENHPLE